MLYLAEKYKVLNLLATTTVTADLNGSGVSVEVYEDDAIVVLQTGLLSSTNATYAVSVSASTAVSGGYTSIGTFTTVSSASDYGVASIPVSLKGTDRKFVRLEIDTTLASGASLVSGIIGATILVRPTIAEAGINSPIVA